MCADCPCPICHCAHYNPLGVTGKKDVKNKPVINPVGGKMECELQPSVTGRGRSSSRGLCSICGQVTGRGLSHPCRPGDVKVVKQGNVDRAQSLEINTKRRRKRNLSLLLGKEEDDAQEQIVSEALSRISKRKGTKFRLKLMEGGGVCGQGKDVSIGPHEEKVSVMLIEVFQDIKKCLNESRKKMEEMCQIMRKNKVKMTPNFRKKLREIDHLLDNEYVTLKVYMTETVTVEEMEDSTEARKTKTQRKTVSVKKDLTILKDPKGFISRLIEE